MIIKNKSLLFQIKNSLGPSEVIVMKIIWQNSKVCVKDVVNILRKKKPVAYTTVMTVMDNLYKKGFLEREKIKKSYYYFPSVERDHIIAVSLSGVFQDLYREFGRRKILYSSLATFIPFSGVLIGYSLSLTLLLTLLTFSSFDLLENLSFFGTLDYLKLLTSGLIFSFDHLPTYIFALFESLPIINLLTTVISFIFVVILVKRLSKLFNFKIPSFLNLGGNL